MPFLLGLVLTPVAAAAGTLVLMLIDAQGLALKPSMLLVGTAIGSAFAAPVTLLVLPLASYAIDGKPYDRLWVHAGIGLLAGTAWMFWVGFDGDRGVTAATLEFCLAGAVGGAACGSLQSWLLTRADRRCRAAGSPGPPAHS